MNLGYCRIFAAADGRITGKAVDPGAYVTPANPLFQIVPTQVWVIANFKETQLKDMRPGQAVTVSVDAYPHLRAHRAGWIPSSPAPARASASSRPRTPPATS